MPTESREPNTDRLVFTAEYNAIWLVVIIGLSLSLAALWLIRQQLDAHKLLDFEWVAHNRIRAINHGIDNGLLAVTTIRDFYKASDEIGPQEFRLFADSLLERHQGIQTLMWVPGADVLGQGGGGSSDGPWLQVLQAQRDTDSSGFRWGADSMFINLLDRARDSGNLAASGRIDYAVEGENTGYGFMAGMPVYRRGVKVDTPELRRRHLLGIVVGLFRLSDLVNVSISLLEPRGVEILLLDESADSDGRFLDFYASRLFPRGVDSSNYSDWLGREVEPKVSERIRVADREWMIVCGQTDLFRSAEAFQEGPWMVLGAGLLFTLLMSVYLVHIKENERERMAIQQQLVEREELFRQMTETVDEVFWAISADMKEMCYLSPAYKRIFGELTAHRDARGLFILDAVPAGDQDRLIQALEQIRQDGVATEAVHRVNRKDRTTRWVRTRGFPVNDEMGRICRIVGFIEDITEKKLADEALRESEAKLRDMFQQSPDIIMTVNKKGKVLLMNRSIPELPAERAVGRNSLALMPYGFRKWFRRALKRVCRKGVTRQFEYSADDGTFWEGRIVPIRADGPVSAAMVIATDVTEKRNLEIQAQHNARLASIGVLSAGVAHEINNPNNAIQFNSSLVSRAWKDAAPILSEYFEENGDFSLGGLAYSQARDDFPRLLSEITRNSERIRRIVENLKHMARQDAGGMMEDVDIQQVLESTLMILHNQIQKYTDVCTLNAPDDLPHARGNSQQLEQVFINTLLNALQSLQSRDSGVFIDARFKAEEEMLEITIRDEGCGIAERDMGRLSEPFFTTKTDTGGTGLGLSISRSIIERHRGSMVFQSEQNAGTTVTIRIPAYGPA
ncbi:MAG: PAS domain S-box protein [Candidatus Sedimenticola sp. (ex Thyasira tokunagai)]